MKKNNSGQIILDVRYLLLKKLVPMEVKVGAHKGVGCRLMISFGVTGK